MVHCVHDWVGISSYTVFVTMAVAMVSQCLCSVALHFYFTSYLERPNKNSQFLYPQCPP